VKGSSLKVIAKRWVIILGVGFLFWGGYLLWPRLVTSSLPVLVLPRDPYAAGFEVGSTQKAAVRELAFDYYQKGLAGHSGPGEKALYRAVKRAKAAASKSIADEIRGLADGSGVPEKLVWESNIAVDLYSNSALMACSVVVAPERGGGFLVGRNLDFFDFGVLHKHTVLLVRPRGKSGWTASLAWPGLAGIITGWNDRGEFCSLNLAVNDTGRCKDKSAPPALFMIRDFLESNSPRGEKLEWLKSRPVSFPMILCFADRKGGAIIEKGALGSRIRTRPDGAAFADNDLICWGAPMGGRCATLSALATGDRKGVARSDVEGALRRVTLGSAFLKTFCTLYSVVFEPTTGRAWVAEGILPATRGPYREVTAPRR